MQRYIRFLTYNEMNRKVKTALHIIATFSIFGWAVPSVGVKEGLSCVIFRAIVAGKSPNLALPSLQHSVDHFDGDSRKSEDDLNCICSSLYRTRTRTRRRSSRSLARRRPRQRPSPSGTTAPWSSSRTARARSSTTSSTASAALTAWPSRDELYKDRSSRRINSRRLFSREQDFTKTFSLTENQFSGKTHFYTIASRTSRWATRAQASPAASATSTRSSRKRTCPRCSGTLFTAVVRFHADNMRFLWYFGTIGGFR